MPYPLSPLPQREALRARIVEVAAAAFHAEGIRSVKMDDIAHRLTISKRTLYEVFADKEELLLACAEWCNKLERRCLEEMSRNADNVLSLILEIFAKKMKDLDEICPSFFADMQKYPRVKAFINERKDEEEDEAVAFLTKGVEQGYFRTGVNFHIVFRYLSAGMDTIIREGLLGRYTQREIFVNTALTIIRGCATIKGVEMIDRFLSEHAEHI